MTDSTQLRFSELIAKMEDRIRKLENGSRTVQMSHTSLENTRLNAYDDTGTLRQMLGKQPDGTYAVTYGNGPTPPMPAGLTIVPRQGAVLVGWDGTFVDGAAKPADFARLDIHISETAGFEPTGATVTGYLLAESAILIPIDHVTHYVRVLSVTTSDAASEATVEVSVLPEPIGAIAAGSIGAEQLAAQIVLSNEFVAGTPGGESLVIDESGLTQYDSGGSVTAKLGPGSTDSNQFTVTDAAGGRVQMGPGVGFTLIAPDGEHAYEMSLAGTPPSPFISFYDTYTSDPSNAGVYHTQFDSDGMMAYGDPATTVHMHTNNAWGCWHAVSGGVWFMKGHTTPADAAAYIYAGGSVIGGEPQPWEWENLILPATIEHRSVGQFPGAKVLPHGSVLLAGTMWTVDRATPANGSIIAYVPYTQLYPAKDEAIGVTCNNGYTFSGIVRGRDHADAGAIVLQHTSPGNFNTMSLLGEYALDR